MTKFASLESATLPADQRTRAELLFMDYTNSPLDTSQLITLLKSRGLAIVNETAAESFLDNVSYFRLAAYMRPMELDDCHTFKPDSTFDNAVALYEFDAKLRVLLFEAI